jgi:hypothetical protein
MCNTPNSYKKFDVTGLNFSPQETKFSPPLDATHDEQSSTLPLLASSAAVPHTTPSLLLSHAGAARVLCAVSPLFPSHVQSHRCSSPACNAGAHRGGSRMKQTGGLNNEGLDFKLLINGGLEAKLQCFTCKIQLPGGLLPGQPGPWIRHWMHACLAVRSNLSSHMLRSSDQTGLARGQATRTQATKQDVFA